jgi:hypothetical protein
MVNQEHIKHGTMRNQYTAGVSELCWLMLYKGTRIVQADSGTDSDSENWRQLAQRMFFVYQCSCVVVAGARPDSLSQTVYQNNFLIPVSDSLSQSDIGMQSDHTVL